MYPSIVVLDMIVLTSVEDGLSGAPPKGPNPVIIIGTGIIVIGITGVTQRKNQDSWWIHLNQ